MDGIPIVQMGNYKMEMQDPMDHQEDNGWRRPSNLPTCVPKK